VISNQYALSRAIRPPAGLTQDFLVSLPAGLALYGLGGAAASFDVGRHYPGPDFPRCAATKVVAKSADVLSQIPSANSGGLARQEFSPYLFSKSLCPCAWGAAGLLFPFVEFSHSTEEVSEWRCHRHETDPNL
jgi:hypothetical protein